MSSVAALLPILNAGEISSGREKDLSKLGMTALDPQTLRITLARPTPWLLDLLTDQTAMPVPRQAIEKWGDRWTQPRAYGDEWAIHAEEWVPLDEIDLMRNPHFHDAAAVKIDEVDDILTDDSSAALKRYETGELDVIRSLPRRICPRLSKSDRANCAAITYSERLLS
ncbi:MAG: ABC transporter substrate-binding protein [Aliidongia sp.]